MTPNYGWDHIASNQASKEITANGVFDAIDEQIFNNTLAPPNHQTDDYTLVLSDANKLIRMDKASSNALTVPPNSSVAFPIGTQVTVRQIGIGTTSIVEGAGVTVNTPQSLDIAGLHHSVSLVKVGTNEWDLFGATAEVAGS